MTEKQRDELLISNSRSLNNLHELLIETKKDLIKRMELSEDKLRSEIKDTIHDSEEKIRGEIKDAIYDSEEKIHKEIKDAIRDSEEKIREDFLVNAKETVEIFHVTWNREQKEHKKINKRLDIHEEEINKLKSKLA